MGLVSLARYVEITGDTDAEVSASASALTALADAQALLEDDLGRPLEVAERVERSELLFDSWGAYVLPKVLPIVSAAGGLTIDGPMLRGASPTNSPAVWGDPYDDEATVTYTAGYQAADASPDAGAETVPAWIERDIAWAAYVLRRPTVAATLAGAAGASSVSLGDASISYGGATSVPSPSASGVHWSRATWKHRRRRL